MIEIRHFQTTDAYDAIPKALKIAKKDKCRIDLTISISGYGTVPITIKIGEKDRVEQLLMRFREALVLVGIQPVSQRDLLRKKNLTPEVCERIQSEIASRLPNGSSVSVDPCGFASVQLPLYMTNEFGRQSRELDQPEKFRIYTKLQDGGWEFSQSDECDTLPEAEDKVVEMIRGPLGSSCMYSIWQGSRVWRSNGQCFGLAKVGKRL